MMTSATVILPRCHSFFYSWVLTFTPSKSQVPPAPSFFFSAAVGVAGVWEAGCFGLHGSVSQLGSDCDVVNKDRLFE